MQYLFFNNEMYKPLYTNTQRRRPRRVVDIALPRNGSMLAGSIPASVLLYKGLRGV